MADYLERYARRSSCRCERACGSTGSRATAIAISSTAGGERFEADQVVVAMAELPEAARSGVRRELDPAIVQLHSSDYSSPAQLRRAAC